MKEKAELLEAGDSRIRSQNTSVFQPIVVRLLHYVNIPAGERRRLSRRAVLSRDGFRCQYCGSTKRLTLDHVVPVSRGGTNTWDNVVTSCAPCNVRKGASLPHEIGMMPRNKPRPPSLTELLLPSTGTVPDSWVQYLGFAAAVS
jgi:5-methylcytosine-specific restriction endonuclease McrA